jgi:septum formation protein
VLQGAEQDGGEWRQDDAAADPLAGGIRKKVVSDMLCVESAQGRAMKSADEKSGQPESWEGGLRAGPAGGGDDRSGFKGRRILLASRSPRRREFLERAGATFESVHPGLDDSELLPGCGTAVGWVMGLAYLKARAGVEILRKRGEADGTWIALGADTTCVVDGVCIGTPRDAVEAEAMIRGMSGRQHEVVSGVALVCPATGARRVFADAAKVWMDEIPDAQIRSYIAGDGWKGKAGAYNLSERISAGWKIRVEGDPTTIMGLPMRRLEQEMAKSKWQMGK